MVADYNLNNSDVKINIHCKLLKKKKASKLHKMVITLEHEVCTDVFKESALAGAAKGHPI